MEVEEENKSYEISLDSEKFSTFLGHLVPENNSNSKRIDCNWQDPFQDAIIKSEKQHVVVGIEKSRVNEQPTKRNVNFFSGYLYCCHPGCNRKYDVKLHRMPEAATTFLVFTVTPKVNYFKSLPIPIPIPSLPIYCLFYLLMIFFI